MLTVVRRNSFVPFAIHKGHAAFTVPPLPVCLALYPLGQRRFLGFPTGLVFQDTVTLKLTCG